MAEESDKENNKSNAQNSRISTDRRTSLDGRQSILPHFRTSFASCDVGTKPRRYSMAGKPNSSNNGRPIFLSHPRTILPSSQDDTNPRNNSTGDASNSRNTIEKTRLSDNGGDSRRNILPHYRTSFVTCNFGGNSRINSTRKPSSSNERNDVVPHYQTSLASCHGGNSRNSSERKSNSSSNLRGSILPHYRTPFFTCTTGGGYPRSSSTGKIQSLNNESNAVQNHRGSILPHYRTSFFTCTTGGGYPRSSSTGKIQPLNNESNAVQNHQSSLSRRNSTGKQSCSNNKEHTNLPLHLRTSSGSCHDSCKHGVLDLYEEKPRVSITKRNIPLPSSNHYNNRRTIVQDERKKPNSFKPKYSSDSEIHFPNSYKIKKETLISCKKRSCSAKSRPTREKPCISPEVSKRLSAKRNRGTNSTMSSPNRSPHLNIYKDITLNSPSRPQLSKQKSEPIRSNPNLAKKTTKAEDSESIQNEIPARSLQSPSPLSSSASPVFTSEEEFSDSDEFELEYGYTDDYESEYSDDEESVVSETNDVIVPENVESKNIKQGEPRRRTKGKIVHHKDEDCAPVKLKFKRGRIVEIEKDDKENGPRRLRFRRGKVLESKEDGKVNGRIRIYKKRIDNGRILKHKSSPKAEKVSLKHQDVEEKKDQQGLLNNVIEETASKLVESRRSKVKALVGAFETVFSTIDTPPSTPTSA